MEENRTLLIVDDEPETLKGYVDFLTPASSSQSARKSSRVSVADASTTRAGPMKGETFQLLTAPSGEKAIELVKAELAAGRRVAAGFFDVKLEGGMDGLTTIQEIKKLDRDVRCVVVTAYHDRTVDEIQDLFGEEFKDHWDYLNKPFTQGEILQKARQMLAAWNRERKLAEMTEQLIRSERMAAIGQVARGIGHEFGNILLRVVGKTDLALMEKDAGKIHEHLKVVMTAAERAGVIVRNLQSFSRTEPSFQHESLARPIEESLSLMNHELTKGNITVEKRLGKTPAIRIDVGRMGQVFLNMFINATHAMPKGGKLVVTLEEAEGPDGRPGVAARVADTGSGIPEDVLPKIFGYAFTTKGDRGSGLGLSVSKEIVESHGGSIRVSSKVGQGTEFTVWLPKGGK